MCFSKKRPLTARQAAIYFIRRKTGLTNAQIGSLFRMKPSAISMVALGFEKKIEEDVGPQTLREMLQALKR